jgi:hypothetical protein
VIEHRRGRVAVQWADLEQNGVALGQWSDSEQNSGRRKTVMWPVVGYGVEWWAGGQSRMVGLLVTTTARCELLLRLRACDARRCTEWDDG